MRLAQDYLSWDIFDFVIVCGGYRAIPLLAFTATNINPRSKMKESRKIPDEFINRTRRMFYFQSNNW